MSEFLNNIVAFEKEINLFTVALRIVLAVVFGGLIGFERGRHGSHAGMRTHILACLGGAMTSLLGVYCVTVLGYDTDPLRISAQVVSGIGFLGAGMIIVKTDKMITGLTTAAIMWTTAIIGIAVGMGFYSGSAIAVLCILFTAAVLTRIEHKRRKAISIYVEINDLNEFDNIHNYFKSSLNNVTHVDIVPAKSGLSGHFGIIVVTSNIIDVSEFKRQTASVSGVQFVLIENN